MYVLISLRVLYDVDLKNFQICIKISSLMIDSLYFIGDLYIYVYLGINIDTERGRKRKGRKNCKAP